MNTESVVYLARKLHWSREEIGKLHPIQFGEILKEVYYQESVDEYQKQYSVASILAAIYNTIPRRRGSKIYKARDFLRGGMPERTTPKDTLNEMADKEGVKLPSK